MSTQFLQTRDIDRGWHVVDATNVSLGRLASRVATVLRGKHRPTFTPNADCGEFVVVINAEKVLLTGNKANAKHLYTHSGIPGGFKAEPYKHLLERKPELAIEKAVKGMLPKTPLGRKMAKKLKVYAGPQHPHQAQQPQPMSL